MEKVEIQGPNRTDIIPYSLPGRASIRGHHIAVARLQVRQRSNIVCCSWDSIVGRLLNSGALQPGDSDATMARQSVIGGSELGSLREKEDERACLPFVGGRDVEVDERGDGG